MNELVLFSIVIPTYNRSDFIKKIIESFFKQSYTNFELIIVDDGSTDNTGEVVKQLNDNRIRYYWKENGERGAARKFGASLAKGDYINYFDCDDIAYENHLQEAVKAIEELNHPMVFYLGSEMRNENGTVVYQRANMPQLGNKMLFEMNYLNPNPVFIHRDTLLEITYNDDRQLSATEDWLYHLQLIARYEIKPYDRVITTCMLGHTGRSMNTCTGENVLLRAELLERYLRQDKVFMKKWGTKLPSIMGEMYALAALHFSLEGKKSVAVKYALRAIGNSTRLLFKPKMAAVAKYVLIK